MGVEGREAFERDLCQAGSDMVIGFLQCLVVLSVEGLVDVKDWKQNQKKKIKSPKKATC